MKIIVTVRGRLKGDEAEAQKGHDATVDQLSAIGRAMGSVGHQAYLNPQDRKEFLAVDTWTSMDGFQKFVGDPNTGMHENKALTCNLRRGRLARERGP